MTKTVKGKFLVYPDKLLKRVAKPVDFEKTDQEARMKIVKTLMDALYKGTTYGNKLGIAAPQLGINKRVIIVRGIAMFNPEWHPSRAPQQKVLEACYSIPNKYYNVYRAQYGWAKWTNVYGNPEELKLTGITAIIFQHEYSHLEGQCCADLGEEVNAGVSSPVNINNQVTKEYMEEEKLEPTDESVDEDTAPEDTLATPEESAE